jgi:acetolactate synthase-1/2/3 large subunit
VDSGISGASALLRSLMSAGVEHVFSSPGSEWAPLWEEFARLRATGQSVPVFTSVRHEELAVSMAAGYAKASGKLPAVVLHTTVGTLHATMALRTATHERVAMVVVAGESIGFGELPGMDPGGQWLNHLVERGGPAALAERSVKWSIGLAAPEMVGPTVARACDIARAEPPGPAFVSLSMESLFASVPDRRPRRGAAPAAVADPTGVADLARLLVDARWPIFVCEDIGPDPAVVGTLVRLAERLGAGVAESTGTHVLNFPRDHPLHAGFDLRAALADADVAVLIGIRAPWHPASRTPGTDLTIVVLDPDPLHQLVPLWGYDADLLLTGAIGPSLAMLESAIDGLLPSTGPAPAAGDRSAELGRRSQARLAADEAAAQEGAETVPLDPSWLSRELARILPSDVVIVEETITPRPIIHRAFTDLRPGGYFNGAFGGLGTGLGTALGVKAARPDALVACLIGDGAFSYDPALAALAACQEHALPILIVVYDDRGYRSQQRTVPRYFPDGYAQAQPAADGLSFDPSPDYAGIAVALGGHGAVVGRPDEIEPAIEGALAVVRSGRFALLDMQLLPVARS